MSNPTSVIVFTDNLAGFLARTNQFGEKNQDLVQQKKNKSPGDGTVSPGFPATESTSKSVAQWPNMVDDFQLAWADWTGGVSTLGFPGSVQKFTGGIQIGDGTGSSSFRLDKVDTGESLFEFFNAGVQSWQFEHDASEDFALQRASGVDVLKFIQSTGLATFAFSVKVDADLEIDGALNHDGSTVGFYGTAPILKRDVSGSRGSGAALVSLIAAGVALGLWTDSTVL